MVKHKIPNRKAKFSEEDRIEIAFLAKVQSYFHLHLENYGSIHGRRIEGTLFLLLSCYCSICYRNS